MRRLQMAWAALSMVTVISVGALGGWPGSSYAGLMDRPRDLLCPPEEYLCPAGYAPRITHMYQEADRHLAYEPLSAPPVSTSAESLPAPPMDVIPGPVTDVPSLPVTDEYLPVGSMAEVVADSRHSTGLEMVDRLNAGNDGLKDASLADVVADPTHSLGQEMATRINGENEGLNLEAVKEDVVDETEEDPFYPVYENVPANRDIWFYEGMYEYDAWDGDGREPGDMQPRDDTYGEDGPSAWDTVSVPAEEGPQPSRIVAMALNLRNAVRASIAQVSRTLSRMCETEDTEAFEPAEALGHERYHPPAFGSPWERDLQP